MSEHYPDHAALAIEAIDKTLGAAPPTIEQAVLEAVAHGRMSEAEAAECLDHYERTFNRWDSEGTYLERES